MKSEKTLYNEFINLGWTQSEQSYVVFQFLYEVAKQVHDQSVLLDLGAGECRYAFFFDHAHYVPVDMGKGDSSWDYARVNVFGDSMCPAFIKDASVDYVLNTVSLDVLHHSPSFLEHVFRVLKPGGKLFLYVPFFSGEDHQSREYFRFASYELHTVLSDMGFAYSDIKLAHGRLASCAQFSRYGVSLVPELSVWATLVKRCVTTVLKTIVEPGFFYLDQFHYVHMPMCWTVVAQKPGKLMPYSGEAFHVYDILQCPKDGSDLTVYKDWAVSKKEKHEYIVDNGAIFF